MLMLETNDKHKAVLEVGQLNVQVIRVNPLSAITTEDVSGADAVLLKINTNVRIKKKECKCRLVM